MFIFHWVDVLITRLGATDEIISLRRFIHVYSSVGLVFFRAIHFHWRYHASIVCCYLKQTAMIRINCFLTMLFFFSEHYFYCFFSFFSLFSTRFPYFVDVSISAWYFVYLQPYTGVMVLTIPGGMTLNVITCACNVCVSEYSVRRIMSHLKEYNNNKQ